MKWWGVPHTPKAQTGESPPVAAATGSEAPAPVAALVPKKTLSGVEWLELIWRGVLVALLVLLCVVVRDLAEINSRNVIDAAAAATENTQRQNEQIRLLKAICIQTAVVYDVARGLCDPQGIAEPRKPVVPKLKGGPYKK